MMLTNDRTRTTLESSLTLARTARRGRIGALGLWGAFFSLSAALACSAEAPLDPGLGDTSGSAGKGSSGSAGGGNGGSAASANGGTSGKGGTTNDGGTGNGGSSGSGTGGSAPAGTGGTSGGSGGAGPAGTGGGGSGGAMNGGSAGSGLGAGRGGRGGAGDAGASGAGASAGGTSGTSGGGSGDAKPSPGCGKSGRPANGQVQVANQSIYKFPTSYDGTKPFPLLIAIHACGNPNTEFVSITDSGGFGTEYVRSFPNTPDSGQCWSNYSADIGRITMQYDELMNNYCIDQNRVFAIAHSSGAQLLVNILSHKSDAEHLNLRGISPVAADPANVAVPMPVLYIDGKMDNQRSADSAKNTVAKFRMSNSCMDTSMPYAPVMGCNSTESGHPAVDPGCIVYDGCSVPTIWCSHNDPNYSGTQHGIPCFAIQSMYDFFKTL